MRSEIADAWWHLLWSLSNFFEICKESGEPPDAALLSVIEALLFIEPRLFANLFKDSFRPISRPAKNDTFALTAMALLVAKGSGLKPASRAIARALYPEANEQVTTHRLRRKFRKDRDWYDYVAKLRIPGLTPGELGQFAWHLNETRQLATDLTRRLCGRRVQKSFS